jgi:hypothetical protein
MQKILLRAAAVFGIFIGLYIVLFPITYGLTTRVVGSFAKDDFVPPVILAPEEPLDGDTTMARIREIAEAVDWPEDDPCVRDAEPAERDAEACAALSERNVGVLERLSAWAEDPGELGPRQREALGRHARAPIAVGVTKDIPSLTPQFVLADLLAITTEHSFRLGEGEAGESALRLMFDLGAYFEHNPSTLIHEMVGVALTNKAIRTALRSVPAESADAVAGFLPGDADRLLSLQLSLGAEWLNLGHFLDHEMRSGEGPFAEEEGGPSPATWDMAEKAGLYDPEHTRQMHDAFWGRIQAATREPPLKDPEIEFETWEDMGLVKYFHNPIGRILHTIAAPAFVRYGARVGNSMDRVAALRVVLAARRFHAADGRWPESTEELGLEWPKSALNEHPLHWDRDANAVRLFDEEEDGLCTDYDECLFPFAPAAGGGE